MAHIESIDALTDLQQAIDRFASAGSDIVDQAAWALRQTEDWLKHRVQMLTAEVERKASSLNACLSYRDEDGNGQDCSAEAAALQEAQERLENARRWMEIVDERAERYRAEARKFTSVLGTRCPAASHDLERKVNQVSA